MESISVNLGREKDHVRIAIIGDAHIGDPNANERLLRERVSYIEKNDDMYVMLLGDLMNNATKGSVSDVYGENLTPMQALQRLVEIFDPIRNRIIVMTDGNHEARSYKEVGVDLTYILACELGIKDRYIPDAALAFVTFGELANGKKESNGSGNVRQMTYSIYASHGRGGGGTVGSKMNALEKLASICDADVYCHAHSHLPGVFKESFFRTDIRARKAMQVEKLFVNSNAYLNYGGYGKASNFRPASLAMPVIWLSGTQREMYGTA